jgi:hypothetical protein
MGFRSSSRDRDSDDGYDNKSDRDADEGDGELGEAVDDVTLAGRQTEVFNAIRRAGDPPHVEFASTEFLLRRSGGMKPVALVASLFHVYLFKRDGWKLYRFWPIDTITIDAAKDDGTPILNIIDDSPDAPLDPDEQGTEWANFHLIATSAKAAREAEERLATIAQVAQAASEAPDPMQKLREAPTKDGKATFEDEDGEERGSGSASSSSESSEESAAEDDEGEVKAKHKDRRRRNAVAAAASGAPRGIEAAASAAASRNAATKSAICGSLTDGELVDYGELTDAYAQGGHEELLSDLKQFVADSDKAVEGVCKEHYTSFLEAAERGALIDVTKAATLGEDLGRHAIAVKSSGDAITSAGKALMSVQRTHSHLAEAETALKAALHLARLLERTEELVSKGMLEGAMESLRELAGAAQPMQHTKLGEYVVKRRHGEMLMAALRLGVLRMNAWLTELRDAAPQLGATLVATALAAPNGGANVRLGLRRPQRAVQLMGDGRWNIRLSTERMSSTAVAASFRNRYEGLTAAGTMAAAESSSAAGGSTDSKNVMNQPPAATQPGTARPLFSSGGAAASTNVTFAANFLNAPASANTRAEFAVCNGATLLGVFQTAGEQATFLGCVQSSRRKQLDLIVSQASTVVTQQDFAAYADQCLGFVLVENILCFSPTLPHLRAPLDVLNCWEPLSNAIVAAYMRVPLHHAADPTSIDAAVALPIARRLVAVANSVDSTVGAIRLSTSVLREAARSLRDRMHAEAVRALSTSLTEIIMLDPLVPMVVKSAAEFADSVTVFHLHLATHLLTVDGRFKGELGRPAAGGAAGVATALEHRLPFSSSVPSVGHAMLAFVTACFDIGDACASDGSGDELMLEYLIVAGRTVSSLMEVRLKSGAFDGGGGMMMGGSGGGGDGGGPDAGAGMLHAALVAANATALAVVMSAVEQRLIVRWRGPIPSAPEKLGTPRLLAPVALELRKVASRYCDATAAACMRKLDAIFLPARSSKYWVKRSQHRLKRGTANPAPASPQHGKDNMGSSGGLNDSVVSSQAAPSTVDTAAATSQAGCCSQAASFIRESKLQLEAFWPQPLVQSICAVAVMHLYELIPSSMNDALRDVETRDTPKLRAAVEQFEMDTVDSVTGLSAEMGVRFPANLKQMITELNHIVEQKEIDYAAEQAEKLRIQAGLEEAAYLLEKGMTGGAKFVADGATAAAKGVVHGTKATAKGVVTGAKATVTGVENAAKATADGVKNAGKATKRGFFGFFKGKKGNGEHLDVEGGVEDGSATPRMSSSMAPSNGPSAEPSPAVTPRAGN